MSETTTLKRKDLPPCPFCGGRDLTVVQRMIYWVYCRDCATSGPTARNAQQAMKRWSERHSQKPMEAVGGAALAQPCVRCGSSNTRPPSASDESFETIPICADCGCGT